MAHARVSSSRMVVAFAVALAPAPALAAIQSSVSGSATVSSYTTDDGKPGRLLSVSTNAPTPIIWTITTTANDHIGELAIHNPSTQQVKVRPQGVSAIDSIRIADELPDANKGFVLLDSATIGDLGSVRVNRVQGATVAGDVLGDIELINVNGNPAQWGNLTSLTVNGDFLGDLYVEKGNIEQLIVKGRVGTPAQPAHVRVDHSIELLRAGELNIDLYRALDNDWAPNFANRIEAVKTWGGSGDMRGVIRLYRLAPAGGNPGIIKIEGAMHGDILIGLSLLASGGSPPMAGRIEVGPNSLHGQVVIAAHTSATHQWTGPVMVGPIQLAPGYPTDSTQLGGGSAALVPFTRRGSESWPPALATFPSREAAPAPGAPIALSHTGPIGWAGEATLPVFFDRFICEEVGWEPVPESDYTLTVAPDRRTILIEPTVLLAPGAYRIEPVAIEIEGYAPLRSAVEADDLAEPIDPYLIEFTIEGDPPKGGGGSTCAADFNADGVVDVVDLNTLLSNYGLTGIAHADGDANEDGAVNSQDLNLLLSEFGGTCETKGGCGDDPGGPIGDPDPDPEPEPDPDPDPDPDPKDPKDPIGVPTDGTGNRAPPEDRPGNTGTGSEPDPLGTPPGTGNQP